MIHIACFLLAIAQVESGNNPNAIGAAGERSAYQMMPGTWRTYTADPFEWATSRPEEAERIATEHARYLSRRIRRLKGFGRMSEHQKIIAMAVFWDPRQVVDYSLRIANLYAEFEREGVCK